MSETTTESPAKPLRLDDGDDLDAVLAEHDYVLVDFYTKGCTLCQSIEPVLGNVARAFTARARSRTESDDVARATDVTVAMLNPQTDLSLVEEYDVRSVPTLVLFEDGEERDRLAEGFQGTDAVVDFIESNLNA